MTSNYYYLFQISYISIIISIPSCVCSHTHLSLWVCSYTYSNMHQRYIYKKFQKQSYFLNIYDYTLLLIYKISMSTYFMYGYIPNVYIITDVQVWSHTPCIYSSLGQICNIWWDTHVGVATSECRKETVRVGHEILHTYSSSVLDIQMRSRKQWKEKELKEFLTWVGNAETETTTYTLWASRSSWNPKKNIKASLCSRTFLLNFIY